MDEDVKIKTGQILLELRKNRGCSQSEVAKYLNITTAAYQNYETGRREANYTNLSKLADFYGVTTDYLLGREPLPDPFADLNLSEKMEASVIEKYMSLPPDMRAMALDLLRQLGSVVIKTEEEEQASTLTREEYCGTLEDQLNTDFEAQKDAG